jgi:outer membrane protein OmpA-like peptidoglycan-associated protein
MNELEQLKSLILHDEQEAIEQIHQDLLHLHQKIDDEQRLFDLVAPHFSQLLLHASEYEVQHFKEAVAVAISNLLKSEADGSFEPVIQKLSPLIYNELRKYIHNHKENVTDLLYPVVGSMISKYVAQMLQDMMNDVNEKIQNGLSIENIKRKMTAKFKGLDESELLLYESLPMDVKAVLLIHKQMGAVITHRIDSKSSIDEPEMVASMLTALTDFINSWIDKQDSFNEVNEINYGTSKIYLEASGHSYLAVLIEGQVTQEFVNVTHTVYKNILEKFAPQIQEFDGDLSTLPSAEINTLFDPLFTCKNFETNEKKELKKWPLLLVVLLLSSVFGYFYYVNYKKESFKAMVLERIHTNEHLTLYNIDASWQDETLIIEGRVPTQKLKEYLFDIVMTKKFDYDVENSVLVVTPLVDYDKTKEMIQKQLDLLNRDAYTDLSFSMNNGVVTLHGNIVSSKQLAILVDILKNRSNVKDLLLDVSLFKPDQDNTIYFAKNSFTLEKEALLKIEKIVFWMMKNRKSKIDVVGYASKSSNITSNMKIAKARAESVKKALTKLHVNPKRFSIKWIPQPPLFSEGDGLNSRCVKIYWHQNEE